MADLLDDAKRTLQTTSLRDVYTAGARKVREIDAFGNRMVASGKKFVSEHAPERLKQLYRDARGYTVKPRSQTGRR